MATLGRETELKSSEEGLGWQSTRSTAIGTRAAPVRDLGQPASIKIKPFALVSERDRQLLTDDLEDAYPLTKLQAGMLFHSELNPGSVMFHGISCFQIQGAFVRSTLESVLQRILMRHSILRTSFDLARFSEPLQLVHRKVELPLTVEDGMHLSFREQEQRLTDCIESEKKRLFDWMAAPLLRFCVLLRKPDSFHLVFSFHRAILDRWSRDLLMAEAFQSYRDSLKGVDTELDPSETAYSDFVALEARTIASSECRTFWHEQLKDIHVGSLPRWPKPYLAAAPEPVRTPKIRISTEVGAALKKLALAEDLPLKTLLLAAHFRVLKELLGHSDVTSGLALHGGSELSGGARTLGLFLNTVPIRLNFKGGTWIDLIRQVFEVECQIAPHRCYPLVEIQRIMGGQSLFEAVFDFIHVDGCPGSDLDGIRTMEMDSFEANHFILSTNFTLHADSSELCMYFDYNPMEICSDQIRALGDYYLNTLLTMAEHPSGRYGAFSPLSVEEKHRILVEWNSTAKEWDRTKCIPDLVEEQVERTPDAVAVMLEDCKLTYSELNRQSNQLAHYLTELGVKDGTPVAICMDRSCQMIVVLLGILKAEGVYVPLEPEYPLPRIESILSSSKVPCLITERIHLAQFASLQSRLSSLRDVICFDELGGEPLNGELKFSDSVKIWGRRELTRFSSVNPVRSGKPDLMAYIIFTSGSTGTPKGVMVTHSPVVNLIDWVNSTFRIDSSDTILFVTSICFDLSVYDIFGILAAGGCIRVASDQEVRDPERLLRILYNEPITFWDSAPAALQQIVPFFQSEPRRGTRLKRIFLSGDWIPLALPDLFKNHFPGVEVIGLGGATEATVWSNYYVIQELDSGWTSIPYGKPIQNCQYYILDEHRNPCPVGVSGDLYIGGECLAAGYLGDPELTDRKFIRHGFHPESETRLYATGDRARYFPDGNIEFLGRSDDQVKIRGFRIELGEIETVLRQHPGIRECIVLYRTDTFGQKRLTAYVVPVASPPSLVELRAHLANNLPEYMVPAAFMVLKALPLTSNGKVDRKALPVPEPERSELQNAFVYPRNLVEEVLAEIWSRVLGLKQIGIHDNFFELGGHSLLAAQAISRTCRIFKADISLRQLFDSPTIAQMSAVIEKARSKSVGQEHVEGSVVAHRDAFPLSE